MFEPRSPPSAAAMSRVSFAGSMGTLLRGAGSPSAAAAAAASAVPISNDLNLATARHALERPMEGLDQAELDVLTAELERNLATERKILEGAQALLRSTTKKKEREQVQHKVDESEAIVAQIRDRLFLLGRIKSKTMHTILITNFGNAGKVPSHEEMIAAIHAQIEKETTLLKATERLLHTYRDRGDEVMQRALDTRFDSLVRLRRLAYTKLQHEAMGPRVPTAPVAAADAVRKPKKKKKIKPAKLAMQGENDDDGSAVQGESADDGAAAGTASKSSTLIRSAKPVEHVFADSPAAVRAPSLPLTSLPPLPPPPEFALLEQTRPDQVFPPAAAEPTLPVQGALPQMVEQSRDGADVPAGAPAEVAELEQRPSKRVVAKTARPAVRQSFEEVDLTPIDLEALILSDLGRAASTAAADLGSVAEEAAGASYSESDETAPIRERPAGGRDAAQRQSIMVVDIEGAMDEERLTLLKTAFLLCDSENSGYIYMDDLAVICDHVGVQPALAIESYASEGIVDGRMNMRQFLIVMGHRGEVDLYAQVFRVVDTRHRGFVDESDLTTIMEMLGMSDPAAEARTVLEANSCDTLTFDQFVDAMIRLG